MKIGLLGGTFNPIHIGHLMLAQECWYRLQLDKVVFMPAYIPPHKEVADNISVTDRLNLLRMTLEGDERFEISTYEIDSGRTSYSVDTVEYFRKKNKKTEIFFITGADSAENLNEWKQIEDILDLTNFVIAARPGWDKKCPYEDKITRLAIPGIDVSSSEIRRRIKEKEPIDYFIRPEAVEYIRNKKLYI